MGELLLTGMVTGITTDGEASIALCDGRSVVVPIARCRFVPFPGEKLLIGLSTSTTGTLRAEVISFVQRYLFLSSASASAA